MKLKNCINKSTAKIKLIKAYTTKQLCKTFTWIKNHLIGVISTISVVISLITFCLQIGGNALLKRLEAVQRKISFETERNRLLEFPKLLIDFSKTNRPYSLVEITLFRQNILAIFHNDGYLIEVHYNNSEKCFAKIKFIKEDNQSNSLPLMNKFGRSTRIFPYFLISISNTEKSILKNGTKKCVNKFKPDEAYYLVAPFNNQMTLIRNGDWLLKKTYSEKGIKVVLFEPISEYGPPLSAEEFYKNHLKNK